MPSKLALRLALASLGLILLSAARDPLRAHHGNAAYDLNSPLTLRATITEFLWANPHVQIYLDAKNAKGQIDHWACETVSPGLLTRAGWKKDELRAGDQVTITLAPAKSGALVGYVLKVVLPDGTDRKLGQGRDRPYP